MPCNYNEMYNSLSILHKKNSSTITNLLEKNKKLYEDSLLKDEELEKSSEKIKSHIKEIEDLTEEVKKSKEKIDKNAKEIDTLNEEMKKLKKNK